jgi:hypothetical protein
MAKAALGKIAKTPRAVHFAGDGAGLRASGGAPFDLSKADA